MKKAEEIYNDALIFDDIPKNYNIFEINCFMSLKILLKQFYNGHITKEKASVEKKKIFISFEKNNFMADLYKEHTEDIRKTEELRIMLRHQLKDSSEQSLETALKLIELYSKEKWL